MGRVPPTLPVEKPKPPDIVMIREGSLRRSCNICHAKIPMDSYTGLCPECEDPKYTGTSRRFPWLWILLLLGLVWLALSAGHAFGNEYPKATNFPPLNGASGLYNDPLAHSPNDMDGPHENTHGANNWLRNYWMERYGGRWNAVYVLRNKAFLIQEPPLRLSDVANATPQNWRGQLFQLYMVTQRRDWEHEPLYVLDEWASYLNGLECDMATSRPHNDLNFQLQACHEFYRYAQILARLADRLGNRYDARQLNGVIFYQGQRLHNLAARLRGAR